MQLQNLRRTLMGPPVVKGQKYPLSGFLRFFRLCNSSIVGHRQRVLTAFEEHRENVCGAREGGGLLSAAVVCSLLVLRFISSYQVKPFVVGKVLANRIAVQIAEDAG